MTQSVDKPTTLSITAQARRGWEKGAQWYVTVSNAPIYGRGATITAAREDAAAQLTTLVENVTTQPACVREPDGQLWILAPHAAGYQSRRIGPDGVASNCHSAGAGTPAEQADELVKHHAGAVRVF